MTHNVYARIDNVMPIRAGHEGQATVLKALPISHSAARCDMVISVKDRHVFSVE